MSPDLATLQSDFSRAILGGERSAVLSVIVGDAETAARGLAVYRNTALSGLCEALRLGFPLCERVVGPEFFEQTALAFARAHPPTEAVLDRYGDGFPDFLTSVPGVAGLPYLPDLARVERAVDQAGRVSHHEHGRSFALALDTGDASVMLSASLRLVSTTTTVDGLWRALNDDDDAALAAVDWNAGGQWLGVHHDVSGPILTDLGEPAWHLCASLLAGQEIEDAVATIEVSDSIDATAIALALLSAPFVRVTLGVP